MRNFLSYILILLFAFGLVINEAAAKRFGGGRSFGVQRSHSSLFSSPAATKNAKSSWGQQSKQNRWGGMLGGMLVGGLLASLFMGNGLGSGLLSWLILGSIIFFIVSFLRKRMQPGLQTGRTNAFQQNAFENLSSFYPGSAKNRNDASYPMNFLPDNFLREAKIKFIRLQTAYDQKNLEDLRAFTAPEVFAEIMMQLDERGEEPNKTEVIHLEAQLLDVTKQVDSLMASVRFTGTIKENNGPISQLDEIWHFRQFSPTAEWVVGGIQQEIIDPLH